MPDSDALPLNDFIFDIDTVVAIIKKVLLFLIIYSLGYFNCSTFLFVAIFALIILNDKWRKEKLDKLFVARAMALGDEKQIILNTLQTLPTWIKFRESEKVDWLNSFFKQIWKEINSYVKDSIPEILGPGIQAYVPDFKFKEIVLGNVPLRVNGIKVYKQTDSRRIEMDIDISYKGDCYVTFETYKITGGIRDIQLNGCLRVVLTPLVSKFPLIGGLQAYFIKSPEVDFDFFKIAQILDVPLIRSKIKNVTMSVINSMLLYPNAYSINLTKGVNTTRFATFQAQGILRVHVVEAKNLVNKDVIGKSDPYVVLKIGSIQVKTAVIENCLNPKWDFWHEFNIEPHADLKIEVWDKDDASKDDSLGYATIDIAPIARNGLIEMSVPLQGVQKGTLYLRLMWLSLSSNFDDLKTIMEETKLLSPYLHTAILMIYLDSALNLPIKSKKLPCSFVELELEGTTNQTNTETETCEPSWNETFSILIKHPPSAILQMKIVDDETRNTLGDLSIKVDILKDNPNMFLRKHTFLCNVPNNNVSICCSLKLRIFKHSYTEEISDNNKEDIKLKKMLSKEESFASLSSTNTNPESGLSSYIEDEMISEIGQIKATLQYSQKRQKLLVHIHEINFFKKRNNPYVNIILNLDKHKTKKKTKVLENPENPAIFNEQFDFLTTSQNLIHSILVLEVKNDETFKNKFLGQAIVALTKYDNMIEPFTDWFNLRTVKDPFIYHLVK